MSNCAGCKHWDRQMSEAAKPRPTKWGECAKLDDVVTAQCDCSYEYSSDVTFSTPEDFGCALFEAK